MSEKDTETVTVGTDLIVLEDDLELVAEIIRGKAQAPELIADPAEVAAEIVDRLLAEKGADVLTAGKALHARDVLNVPIMLQRVRWARSRYDEGGPGVFALLEGVRGDTGEQIVVTCGGVFVMVAALVLVRDEALPLPVQITETEAASGRRPLRLEPAS